MKSILTAIALLALLSCGYGPASHNEAPQNSTSGRMEGDTMIEQEEQLDSISLPIRQALENVLTTGIFHADEVWAEAKKQRWYGLFEDKNGFYISETKLNLQNIEDPIGDENGAKTGWEVKTKNSDTSYVLLSKIKLAEGRVEDAAINLKNLHYAKKTDPESYENIRQPSFSILPGEQIDFTFKNIAYSLFATGTKYEEQGYWFPKHNYKLTLKASANGRQTEQVIVAMPQFDDSEIRIIWIGDIDKDDKIDLIIDVSDHYNQSRIAVFLSSKAGKNELVRYFGECSQVGC
jgi:hypothetical protein